MFLAFLLVRSCSALTLPLLEQNSSSSLCTTFHNPSEFYLILSIVSFFVVSPEVRNTFFILMCWSDPMHKSLSLWSLASISNIKSMQWTRNWCHYVPYNFVYKLCNLILASHESCWIMSCFICLSQLWSPSALARIDCLIIQHYAD